MQVFGVVLVLVAAAVIDGGGRGHSLAPGRRRERARGRGRCSLGGKIQEQRVGDREVRGLVPASMEEGVLLVDHEGERVFANEALERHLGDEPTKAELLLPTALRDAVRRAGYTGATVRVEVETGARDALG